MMQMISQLLSAALGSISFGLIFNLNRRYLPAAGVGGFLAWLAYRLAFYALPNLFLANLLAGFCAALYAEVLARRRNAPSTPFFITELPAAQRWSSGSWMVRSVPRELV